jgi:hypothetical protein
MGELLRRLWQLCLLRIGPQDLPYSPTLSRNLVVAALAAGLVNAFVVDSPVAELLPRLLVTLGFLVAVPWLLLQVRGGTDRLAQTIAALAGSSLLYAIAFLPLTVWAAGRQAAGEPDTILVLVGWAGLLLTGWKIAINAHIWRHAMNLPFGGGLLLAFGLLVVQIGLAQLFGAIG